MRLATILPENGAHPIAAVSVDAGNWVSLHGFLSFFGVRELPPDPSASLNSFLPSLMPRFSEFTRKINDWPEHGRLFHARGGRSFRAARFFPPILRPPAFRNFAGFEQHVRTVRHRRGLDMAQAWYEMPVFYFSNPNSLIGDGGSIAAPSGSNELDFGLALGVIIGARARNISPFDAWRSVAGITIINDFSARDIQRAEMSVGIGPAKAKDFATTVGPVLVTRDEFADKIEGETLSLEMAARLNGRDLSRGNSNSLFHSIPRMIAHASRDADLFAGDLIGTGIVGSGCILELSPEHTGGWLKPGDVIELQIERIGVLRTKITTRS
jgi:fumarylacetoacetate (FAA) hydrolase